MIYSGVHLIRANVACVQGDLVLQIRQISYLSSTKFILEVTPMHTGFRSGEIWGHLVKNGRLILRSSMNDVRANFEPHVQYEEENNLVEILEGIHAVGVIKWPYFVECFHYRLQLQKRCLVLAEFVLQ